MVALGGMWRFLAGSVLLGVLSLGCSHKSDPPPADTSTPRVTLSGTVKYTRIPLLKGTDGRPTGLATDVSKFQELPARGVMIRVFQGKSETQADGTVVTVWKGGTTSTDSTGNYSFSVEVGLPTFVEVLSFYQGSTMPPIRISADPAGIQSRLPVSERLVYALRKAADGTAPAGNPLPGVAINANATVDFKVGTGDVWWLTPTQTTRLGEAVLEATGTGSRILAMLDDAYQFSSYFGDPTPGYATVLHYRQGLSEPQGTYLAYDRDLFPKAFDGAALQYFGSVRAGATNDDAWDQAVLFELFARNRLLAARDSYLRGGTSLPTLPPAALPIDFLVDRSDLQDLAPDQALLEGFASGMAAALLKIPFLADTYDGGITVRDLRETTGLGNNAFSAPNLASLYWALCLKANGLTAPGTLTDWEKIDPLALRRLASFSSSMDEMPNIYAQLARLKEGQGAGEPVNLSSIFTDDAIKTLVLPFGLTWPRVTSGAEAKFLTAWPKDPDLGANAIPAFTLKMGKARQGRTGAYSNLSIDEVVYARFQLSRDRVYDLSVQTTPALPSTALIEVVSPFRKDPLLFGDGHSVSERVQFGGSSSSTVYVPLRVRVLSPTVQQPDLTVTLRLTPQN